jgi:hypothetical protein
MSKQKNIYLPFFRNIFFFLLLCESAHTQMGSAVGSIMKYIKGIKFGIKKNIERDETRRSENV